MKAAYWSAVEQFNNLALDQAQATLEGAISAAQGAGLAADPALAPLLVLRGGIIYTNTANRTATIAAFEEAVRVDYQVQLPIELRSDEIQVLLDEARRRAGQAPMEGVLHDAPTATLAGDLEFEALMGVPMPDGAQVALYWRKMGEPDFQSVSMDMFGNLATATIPASEHGGSDLEYFIYAFDVSNQPLANKGDQDAPLMAAGTGPSTDTGAEGEDTGGEGEGEEEKPPPKGPSSLPRVFINLGVGAGVGIARGNAELTYRQFSPLDPNFQYSEREQACAIARWFGPDGEVAENGTDLAGQLATINQEVPGAIPQNLLDMDYLPGGQGHELDQIYDADACAERHPIKTGMALSPFFIAPEIAFRIGRAFVLGVFTRLQIVTGSKVYRGDDPDASLPLNESFANMYGSDNPFDPTNPTPGVVIPAQGQQHKPPFTWAVGLKAKYFLGKDEKKFRPFVGGFAGYGQARLRVPMGFANDHSGNSIPDDQEIGCDGAMLPSGQPGCDVAVWPYNTATVSQDVWNRALSMQQGADTAQRIDTIAIGQGFVGALFGFNFQLHKNFSIFAELDAGAWFPNTTSGLFDLQVGPAITF
jgi:hypothetical protein